MEKYLSDKTSKAAQRNQTYPHLDEWYYVDLDNIDQSIFQEPQNNYSCEETRQIILEAFAEVKKNPKKYPSKFKTMFRNNSPLHEEDFEAYCCKFGDHSADWVEQALEWAQRICFESWWDVCIGDDKGSSVARAVLWKDGKYHYVGAYHSVTYIHDRKSYGYTRPLIVGYDAP